MVDDNIQEARISKRSLERVQDGDGSWRVTVTTGISPILIGLRSAQQGSVLSPGYLTLSLPPSSGS